MKASVALPPGAIYSITFVAQLLIAYYFSKLLGVLVLLLTKSGAKMVNCEWT
jgi:hypothetical protein